MFPQPLNILYVVPFVPYPLIRGTNQRVFHLMKALSCAHNITAFCLQHEVEEISHKPVFEMFCQRVIFQPTQLKPWRSLSQRFLDPIPDTIQHWYQPEVEQHLRQLLLSQNYDLIFCEDICMTHYFLRINPQIPVITDRNRVDYEFLTERKSFIQGMGARLSFLENHAKIRHFEKKVLKRFPHQVVCSEDDYNFMKAHLGVKEQEVAIIRNGVDPEFFSPRPPSWKPPSPTLCFTGAMDYLPNQDGLHWFFEDIYPRILQKIPNLQVYLVGICPGPEIQAYGKLPGVHVTGRVEDISAYYANCDVYICPIRIGGGTRLKIVEAMAMKKPVVSTTIGCQGLDLIDKKHLLKRDSAKQFATAIVELLNNPSDQIQLAESGHAFVLSRFTWEQLGLELEPFLAQIAQIAQEVVCLPLSA